jgi:hypothetical protein
MIFEVWGVSLRAGSGMESERGFPPFPYIPSTVKRYSMSRIWAWIIDRTRVYEVEFNISMI